MRGRFTVFLKNKPFTLKPGMCVWIPPRVWHIFKTGRTAAEAFSLFSPALSLSKKPDVIRQKTR